MDLVRVGDSEVAIEGRLEVEEEVKAKAEESPADCFRAWPILIFRIAGTLFNRLIG